MSDDQLFGEGHFDVGVAISEQPLPAAVISKRREDKPKAALLRDFSLSFMEIAKVLTHGAIKHGAHDWTYLPESAIEEYEHAADRHDLALWSGEVIDADSQCLHEAMAITDRLITLELKLRAARAAQNGEMK